MDNKSLINGNCLFPQLIAEETEVQRRKAMCSTSHIGLWQGQGQLTSGLGLFPSQSMNHSSGNKFGFCCLKFSLDFLGNLKIPNSQGGWRKVQGCGPKYKIIWNLTFELRNSCWCYIQLCIYTGRWTVMVTMLSPHSHGPLRSWEVDQTF